MIVNKNNNYYNVFGRVVIGKARTTSGGKGSRRVGTAILQPLVPQVVQ